MNNFSRYDTTLSLDTEAIRSSKETGALFDIIIKPGWRTAIIGPNTSPVDDAIGLKLSERVGEQGIVYCIDPKSGIPDSQVEHVVGVGNAIAYQESINLLRYTGMRLAPFEILGPQSSLVHIPKRAKNLQCIADHGTFSFIGMSSNVNNEYLFRGHTTVADALQQGGLFITQVSSDNWFIDRFGNSPEKLFQEIGRM